ncbi:MAG: hypothetical protein V3T31_05330 [candidate division Zixibacteria bacterium]
MKKLFTLAIFALLVVGITGCDEDDSTILIGDFEPTTPQGVFSVSGNDIVYVIFNGTYDTDLDSYAIYRAETEDGEPVYIGSVTARNNPAGDTLFVYSYEDREVANGDTYFYYVTAINSSGHESAFSAEFVMDTPRFERSIPLFATDQDAARAGFDFVLNDYVDSSVSDVVQYFDTDDGVMYLTTGKANTDIQDVGYTEPFVFDGEEIAFDDVDVAPADGWSNNGFVEVIEGHTYVIWTAANRYAKMRADLVSVAGHFTAFTFAYQKALGNPDLSGPADAPLADTKSDLDLR